MNCAPTQKTSQGPTNWMEHQPKHWRFSSGTTAVYQPVSRCSSCAGRIRPWLVTTVLVSWFLLRTHWQHLLRPRQWFWQPLEQTGRRSPAESCRRVFSSTGRTSVPSTAEPESGIKNAHLLHRRPQTRNAGESEARRKVFRAHCRRSGSTQADPARDWHLLGWQLKVAGDVFGTFGVASASFNRSRAATATGRLAQYILGKRATTWHQLVADDKNVRFSMNWTNLRVNERKRRHRRNRDCSVRELCAINRRQNLSQSSSCVQTQLDKTLFELSNHFFFWCASVRKTTKNSNEDWREAERNFRFRDREQHTVARCRTTTGVRLEACSDKKSWITTHSAGVSPQM